MLKNINLNKMFNKSTQNLITSCYNFLKIIIFIYTVIISILFYAGPLETKIVKKQLKKNPVDIIVSLASTPYRINTIQPVLDSISRQSIKPTRVYLNLPFKSRIYPDQKFIIPDWLKKYPNLIINRTEQDYGPATKLIPTLKKELNPNTIIITIDDDRLYPKHMIRDLVKRELPGFYNSLQKEAVITGYGVSFLIEQKSLNLYQRSSLPNKKILTIHGSYGVAYKRKFFNNDIFSLFNDLPIDCFLTDDLMLPSYLAANNIDIINLYGGSFSYNKIMFNLAFQDLYTAYSKNSIQMGANGKVERIENVGEKIRSCLASLPYIGKIKYQRAIIEKSNLIYSSTTNTLIFFNKILQFCYDFFIIIIYIMPYVKKIFIYTMI